MVLFLDETLLSFLPAISSIEKALSDMNKPLEELWI